MTARARRRPLVMLLASLVAVAVSLSALLLALRHREAAAADPGEGVSASGLATPAGATPLEVLRAWEARRAAAWAAGDVSGLRDLYAPGSAAGRADVRLLQRYVRRGLHIEGLQTQILGLTVRDSQSRRLVLDVTDRLVGGTAVGPDGDAVRLPVDRPSAHRITMRLIGDRWLVSDIVG